VSVGDHFERVAAVYESLRTTDEAPVRTICQLLPDRPVTGLDIGCGTGRYSRLLRALLPDGSRLAASDVSVLRGKYWRSSPLVFSLLPRCQGLWGSQK
jgi:ubiquinone/menaquinone biosynthesis C-methylase UbiE